MNHENCSFEALHIALEHASTAWVRAQEARDAAQLTARVLLYVCVGLLAALLWAGLHRPKAPECPAPSAPDTLQLDPTEIRAAAQPGVWI